MAAQKRLHNLGRNNLKGRDLYRCSWKRALVAVETEYSKPLAADCKGLIANAPPYVVSLSLPCMAIL